MARQGCAVAGCFAAGAPLLHCQVLDHRHLDLPMRDCRHPRRRDQCRVGCEATHEQHPCTEHGALDCRASTLCCRHTERMNRPLQSEASGAGVRRLCGDPGPSVVERVEAGLADDGAGLVELHRSVVAHRAERVPSQPRAHGHGPRERSAGASVVVRSSGPQPERPPRGPEGGQPPTPRSAPSTASSASAHATTPSNRPPPSDCWAASRSAPEEQGWRRGRTPIT